MTNLNHSLSSDNASGIHADVLEAIRQANVGHAVSYGSDPWTEKAHSLLRTIFGRRCEIFFTFTGTAANVLALSAVTRSYAAVVCSECSHIATDECGAPERLLGAKLMGMPHQAGKVSVEAVESRLYDLGVQHHNQPRVLSLTQPTELGTLYTVDELGALTKAAHRAGMAVHMDGARLANACAALNCEAKAITKDVGVDVLSFGLTKNGALDAEAVIVFDPKIAADLSYQRKQQMQLASKMRYLSAQFIAMLDDGLWLRNARHANEMAAKLASGIEPLSEVNAVYPVEANALFVEVPSAAVDPLREVQYFYTWNPAGPIVRWMASFDTPEAVVDTFIDAVRAESLRHAT